MIAALLVAFSRRVFVAFAVSADEDGVDIEPPT
jgi:hypothetical protein